ncbi:ABC transporter permease [Desulfatibacillum aliphaticivorans]|uniref:ABC transporter permease n=1 Tax=Desulfatibacillum aliphaticivorans TaxID=218208 RepID=UPI000421D2E6|nr:FtsX-like permease family protein [Desulfatibacillum aliphaticivorans]
MFAQLAWRNLWRNPRRTAIILLAIFMGVFSMIFFAAFSRGMANGMVNNAIDNLVGHIKIQHPDYRSDPDISHRIEDPRSVMDKILPVLPEGSKIVQRIRVEGVAANARETAGIEIAGIEPSKEKGVSFIGDAPIEGEMLEDGDKNGILLGAALADRFDTEVGKKLVLTTQRADGETQSRAFRIRGLYHAEIEATEKAYVFITLDAAKILVGDKNGATEIAATLPGKKVDRMLQQTVSKCKEALKPLNLSVFDWMEQIPAMKAYLAMFDMFLYIWFVVVFIAMGFGIVNTVLMAVYERMREFGLLKAIGMKPSWIIRMVLGESSFLLIAGCAAGTLCSLAFTWYVAMKGIDLGSFAQGVKMWGMSRMIYPAIDNGDVIAANAVVIVLGLIVSIYPAVKAARFTPVETMRHN